MTRLSSFIALVLLTLFGTSLAQPAREAIPDRCAQFQSVPRDSRSVTLPWELRLSFAACRQAVALVPTTSSGDFPGVIAKINRAMDPSIAIYRQAAAGGPTPQIRILAEYGLGMVYINSMVRARNAVAVPQEALTGTGDAYQQVHQPMEALLVPYRDGAVTALDEVGRLATENPAVLRANPVMTFVIADAKATSNLVRSTSEAPTPSVSRR